MHAPRKICRSCRKSLPYYEFSANLRMKDGCTSDCLSCLRLYKQQFDFRETSARYRQNNRMKGMIRAARQRSLKLGVDFDLDQHAEALRDRLAINRCEMTGMEFNRLGSGRQEWNSPTLDRIEPAAGYVYGNVRVVIYAMNAILGNWGEDVARIVFAAWYDNERRTNRVAA